MKNSWRISLLAASLTVAVAMPAQEADSTLSRHVVSSTTAIGIGPAKVLDTYISQEKFRGVGLTFLSQTEWAKEGKKWRTVAWHQGDLATVKDRGKSAHELAGTYQLYLGKLRWWNVADGLRLGYARSLYGLLGFLYNTSNTNNPAQARLMARNINSGLAEWDFSLWNKPFRLRYQLDFHMFGLMFSPNYGQSYYEIFNRGNYDHNICIVSFWRMPSMRHQLMLDIPISRRLDLTVGYLGDYQQTKANNLKTNHFNHRFMIGIRKRFRLINYRP